MGRDNIRRRGEGAARRGKEREREKDPDAACSPRPLDPPVTTTTFLSSEKMFLKSLSSVWAIASASGIMQVCLPGAGVVFRIYKYHNKVWPVLCKVGISAARFMV